MAYVCKLSLFLFLTNLRPPRSTTPYTLFPYTTLFRAAPANADDAASEVSATDMLRGPLEQITRQAEAMRVQSFGHLKSVYTGYAGDIATAARHLRTLIDDVFDVAAIDSGTVEIGRAHV